MTNYHVLTPMNRYENLRRLVPHLESQKIIWHVVVDDEVPFHLSFKQPWIYYYRYPNVANEFWARCNSSLNWLLDTLTLPDDDYVCFLNDDDGYEPGFFDKLREHQDDVIVTSMKRGNQTPAGVRPERAHGTNTLEAKPENMKVGYVGVEQMFAKAKIMKYVRLPIHIAGDGQMIEYVYTTNPVKFLPEANVLFNYFEPGRWL